MTESKLAALFGKISSYQYLKYFKYVTFRVVGGYISYEHLNKVSEFLDTKDIRVYSYCDADNRIYSVIEASEVNLKD